jgi:hypothetical protein
MAIKNPLFYYWIILVLNFALTIERLFKDLNFAINSFFCENGFINRAFLNDFLVLNLVGGCILCLVRILLPIKRWFHLNHYSITIISLVLCKYAIN